MLRTLSKLCLVGAPVLMMACTGEIGVGDGTGRPTTPGGKNGGGMEPGGGTEPGTKPPGDMRSNLDPPMTISGGGKCMANKPGPRMLRRLTTEQLDNSVRDLFKNPAAPKSDVFNDPQILGFTGDANALLVRDLGSQQLMSYAEQVARWAVSTLA